VQALAGHSGWNAEPSVWAQVWQHVSETAADFRGRSQAMLRFVCRLNII